MRSSRDDLSMRRGRRGRRKAHPRRLAAVAIAVMVLSTAAATAFSCFGRPVAVDLSIPRELAGAPVIRVALTARAPERATVEVLGPYAAYAGSLAEVAGPSGPGPATPRGEPALRGAALEATEVKIAGRELIFGRFALRAEALRIVPQADGTLAVDGTRYRGDLVLRRTAEGGALLLVNQVSIEEYIAGVLGSEMPLAFPEEALRAQAVAARSYAVYQMRVRQAEPFDVGDTVQWQVYKGLANETPKARRVVVDTLGVVLTFGRQLFCTYFHSTCGGETVPASFAFAGAGGAEPDIPPLAGAQCGSCGDSKHFRWEVDLAKADVAERLAKAAASGSASGSGGLTIRDLARVEVAERGPGGHVSWVRVRHRDGGETLVRATRLRLAVGPAAIKSTRFDVEDRGDRLVFRGQGFGHGAGLCQMGARGMAAAGFDAVEILRRYYPGAERVRLYAPPPTTP